MAHKKSASESSISFIAPSAFLNLRASDRIRGAINIILLSVGRASTFGGFLISRIAFQNTRNSMTIQIYNRAQNQAEFQQLVYCLNPSQDRPSWAHSVHASIFG